MVLRDAGLVEDRREGARIFYRVTKPEVYDLMDFAIQMSGAKANQARQVEVKDCPCPKCNPVAEGLGIKD
jgi:hypothetical protein